MDFNNTIRFALLGSLLTSTLVSANTAEKAYPGFNFSQIGIQNITYKETLKNFATIGDLTSEIDVNNTVLVASSYTHLYDDWGFTLTTQGTLLHDITSDSWSVKGYGVVQTNDSKIAPSDLQTSAVKHFDNGNFLRFGGQLKSLSFTRSNLVSGDGSESLNRDIRNSDKYFADSEPPQLGDFAGAIQEDLTYMNIIVGAGHNSLFLNNKSPLYWFANATLSTPLYFVAQNTQIQADYGVEDITASLNGYEVQATAGLGLKLSKGVAVSLSFNVSQASYKEASKTFDDDGVTRTAAIPDVEFGGYQATLGITWIN